MVNPNDFHSLEAYRAYQRAEARGQVRIFDRAAKAEVRRRVPIASRSEAPRPAPHAISSDAPPQPANEARGFLVCRNGLTIAFDGNWPDDRKDQARRIAARHAARRHVGVPSHV